MYFSKTVIDPEIGEINLRKQAGIRNIRLTVHPRRGISVTIPWYLRYSDGIKFAQSRKDWIEKTAERQKTRIDKARKEGRGMPSVKDGVTIRTIHQEIIIRRSPQTTLFSIEESSERTISSYGKTASKRRGTISQTTPILTTDRLSPQTAAVFSPYLEGSASDGSISVCSITYPYEWGAEIAQGTTEEKMIIENIIKILRKEAKSFLPARLEELASEYGFKYNGVAIKNNLTNWGSCSSKGNINLNLHLVRLSRRLCDYVILHELCHLRQMDHSKSFHELLSDICAAHFNGMSDEAGNPMTGQEIEKHFSRQLRKYYLW